MQAIEAEPPLAFRRFPWAALVFCLACLTMTAWTWMRYSYRHHTTVAALHEARSSESPFAWHGYYVQLSGRLLRTQSPIPHSSWSITETVDGRVRGVWAVFDDAEKPKDGERGRYVGGRLIWVGRISIDGVSHPITSINVSASRFHGASIAGLLVGAIGCLIFGLYLRGIPGHSGGIPGTLSYASGLLGQWTGWGIRGQ